MGLYDQGMHRMTSEDRDAPVPPQAPEVPCTPAGAPHKKKPGTPEERELVLNAWKAVVEVQMHFNDMLMRIRNLGITLILAVFGAAALSLQYELFFQLSFFRFHLATLVITFGLVAWVGIGFVDRYYHKLLVGAVTQSTRIEDIYDEDWFGMTHAITEESRTLFGRRNLMTARRQMFWFLYAPILLVGLIFALAVMFWFQPTYGKATVVEEVARPARAPQAAQPSKAASPGQPIKTPDPERPSSPAPLRK